MNVAGMLRPISNTSNNGVMYGGNLDSKGCYIDYDTTYDAAYDDVSTASLSTPHVSSADCLTYLQQVYI